VSAYCRFCATNWLNIGACVQLREVSVECRFILQYMWGKKFGNSASGHLTEGVRLIWGLLDTGFTVLKFEVNLRSQLRPVKTFFYFPFISPLPLYEIQFLVSTVRKEPVSNMIMVMITMTTSTMMTAGTTNGINSCKRLALIFYCGCAYKHRILSAT